MKGVVVFFLVSSLFVVGCGDDTSGSGGNIRWADSVIAYSTQYDSVDWSAHQALDAPNTYPDYGDIETAWTSEFQDGGREFLELGFFENPQPVAAIAIFETYKPGFVDTVYVKNDFTGLWEVVFYDSAKAAGDTSRINIINFTRTSFNVFAIRIAMDMAAVPGWNEIDAVGISPDPIPDYTDRDYWGPYWDPLPDSPVKVNRILTKKK